MGVFAECMLLKVSFSRTSIAPFGSDACFLTLFFLLSQYSIPSLYLASFTLSAGFVDSPRFVHGSIEGKCRLSQVSIQRGVLSSRIVKAIVFGVFISHTHYLSTD